jgi:dimethylsulfide dehydrogenase subunit gamma
MLLKKVIFPLVSRVAGVCIVVVSCLLVACSDTHQVSSLENSEESQQALLASIPLKSASPYSMGSVIELAIESPESELANPAAKAWASVDEYKVELAIAPPVHPSVSLRHDPLTPALPVNFSVASDNENYYVRVRWSDDSENRQHSFDKFADAAAIQFALQGGMQTSFMMGSVNAPVNMWYWNASKNQPQNLLASGFGTVTDMGLGKMSVHAEYLSGAEPGWVVVFTRPITVADDDSSSSYEADFADQEQVHFSLGVWQGQDKQRDGLKRIFPGWITVARHQTVLN